MIIARDYQWAQSRISMWIGRARLFAAND